MIKRIFILVCLLSFSFTALAYDAHKVYERLLTYNTDVPALELVVLKGSPDWCPVACTDGHAIFVTTYLIEEVKNEDELAGVIGHEMAHKIHSDEMKADVLGLQYAENAKYNYCKAAQILKRFGEDDEHPDGKVRYKNTGCG